MTTKNNTTTPFSAEAFISESGRFGCDMLSDFTSSFNLHPETANNLSSLIKLPDWATPTHVLVALSILTGDKKVDRSRFTAPSQTEVSAEQLTDVAEAIAKLFDSIVS